VPAIRRPYRVVKTVLNPPESTSEHQTLARGWNANPDECSYGQPLVWVSVGAPFLALGIALVSYAPLGSGGVRNVQACSRQPLGQVGCQYGC